MSKWLWFQAYRLMGRLSCWLARPGLYWLAFWCSRRAMWLLDQWDGGYPQDQLK